MYPNISAACNYDKDVKVLTILDIEGVDKDEIVDVIGHLTVPNENSVNICNKYLNLPNYSEMSKLFKEHNKDTQ